MLDSEELYEFDVDGDLKLIYVGELVEKIILDGQWLIKHRNGINNLFYSILYQLNVHAPPAQILLLITHYCAQGKSPSSALIARLCNQTSHGTQCQLVLRGMTLFYNKVVWQV